MSLQRSEVLVCIALGLLPWSAQVSSAEAPVGYSRVPLQIAPAEPLPGKSSVSGLEVKQNENGLWMVSFDYYFTGAELYTTVRVDLDPEPGPFKFVGPMPVTGAMSIGTPIRGTHHQSMILVHPGTEKTTHRVRVAMLPRLSGEPMLASQQIDVEIEWPSYQSWWTDYEVSRQSPQENLDRAITLVDSGGDNEVSVAKSIVERLIAKNPRFDAAYVQLARIAFRSNWSPEGFHQAENLLSSALQIRPDSADAKILLGFVYTNQRRLDEAEALLALVAKSNPPNLWLWANWGEALALQGKIDQAIAKYRVVLDRPMAHDANDRARSDAYQKLLGILKNRQDLDGMEALYRQQITDFGAGSCYSTDYARFLLQIRGDTQGAIDLTRRALHKDCDDAPAREILGLAQYVKWAATSGAESAESLNQARIFLSAGPMLIYLLASSERTTATIEKLLSAGEQIDQMDSDRMTGLAYALQKEDLAAAKRLLKLGARPATPVGIAAIPVALMTVLEGNVEATRMLQQSGVDYSKLRYQGASALEIARQSGNAKMLRLLTRKGVVL